MLIIRIGLILLIGLNILSCSRHEQKNESFKKYFLKEWTLKSSTQVDVDDNIISSDKFNDDNWIKVQVPTTVLHALVKAKIYPDPHFDLNNFKIPDACDSLNESLGLGKFSHLKNYPNPFKKPYWFRTKFIIPSTNKNKRIWLNFDGINYRADVWVNGKQIADSGSMVGMFRRFKYDITEYVNRNKTNILAVKIYQVDHPGKSKREKQWTVFGPSRGSAPGIFKDVTLKLSGGWDCAPVVRDRNMGLYQDVYLTFTNAIDIIDPYIVTELPLPDTAKATISIQAELKNSDSKPQKGILKGSIDLIKEVDFYTYKKIMPGKFETVHFEKQVEIPANKTVNININADEFPQLVIDNPYLWWPNGYGKQYLHNLKLSFEINGEISDVENTTFGIRKITTALKEINGEYGRIFFVNGKKIFSRGGWVQPDMMMDMNKARIYNEVRMLANANINMIASEDMPSPPDYIMDACDKYGLLTWETFYQCWRMYPGMEIFKNPLDAKLALKNSYDIIKRYRSHPSLIVWLVANEVTVREEIYKPLREYIRTLDTTRVFLPTSNLSWDVELTPYIKDDLPLGTTDNGEPDYTWYPHPFYYNKVLEIKQQMFRNEMGVPSVPTLSSMKKFIFDLGKGEKNNIYPLDKNWAHHGAWGSGKYAYKNYDVALRERYGEPTSVEDYIRKAQFVNAGSYRAMFEAANHRMWDITQGVMIWKLNSTWPTVLWQLYDWFLNPTSAYYFTKKALEPLHIQLNENNFTVSVINTQYKIHKNLKASVKIIDFNQNVKWKVEKEFTIEENRYKELLKLPEIKNITPTYFVKLQLKNNKGKIVSDNFYWFSKKEKEKFFDLAKLEKVKLDYSTTLKSVDDEYEMIVRVKNPTNKIAFFKHFAIVKKGTNEEVLPTFWSDNFFTLFPGEVKTVKARFAKLSLGDNIPIVMQN